jgi:hypothetical protein
MQLLLLLLLQVYDFGVLQLSPRGSDVLMVVSAAAVGALSCYLAFKFSLDASMRLFVITFLIVSGALDMHGLTPPPSLAEALVGMQMTWRVGGGYGVGGWVGGWGEGVYGDANNWTVCCSTASCCILCLLWQPSIAGCSCIVEHCWKGVVDLACG